MHAIRNSEEQPEMSAHKTPSNANFSHKFVGTPHEVIKQALQSYINGISGLGLPEATQESLQVLGNK